MKLSPAATKLTRFLKSHSCKGKNPDCLINRHLSLKTAHLDVLCNVLLDAQLCSYHHQNTSLMDGRKHIIRFQLISTAGHIAAEQ